MGVVITFLVLLLFCIACFVNAVRLIKKRKNALRVWAGPALEVDLPADECQASRSKVLSESFGRMKNHWMKFKWQEVTPPIADVVVGDFTIGHLYGDRPEHSEVMRHLAKHDIRAGTVVLWYESSTAHATVTVGPHRYMPSKVPFQITSVAPN